jgi:hypothetical protein
VSVPVEQHLLGEERVFRVYAGQGDLEGTLLTVSTDVLAAAPLAPVHLRAERGVDGGIGLNWVRCSRADGDGWGVGESPLEHNPELYRVGIWDGSTLVRTFDCPSATASYGAADQVADFGEVPGSFEWTVSQVSTVLGVGVAARGVFNG